MTFPGRQRPVSYGTGFVAVLFICAGIAGQYKYWNKRRISPPILDQKAAAFFVRRAQYTKMNKNTVTLSALVK